MKLRIVFWDVLPCKIIVDRLFRGTCCLHHQGWVTHPWWWRQHASLKRRSTIILHGSTSQKTITNLIKMFVLRDVASCSLLDVDRWFRRAYCLHHQCVSFSETWMTILQTTLYHVTAIFTRQNISDFCFYKMCTVIQSRLIASLAWLFCWR
jgi:hypothetical protein